MTDYDPLRRPTRGGFGYGWIILVIVILVIIGFGWGGWYGGWYGRNRVATTPAHTTATVNSATHNTNAGNASAPAKP